jgi:hypothetical protein
MVRNQLFTSEPLPGGDNLPVGWFAISDRFLDGATERRRARNQWYRLKGQRGTIYRVLRFAPNLMAGDDVKPAGLAVDYQGWWELQGLTVPADPILSLDISRVGNFGRVVAACKHPDPTYRMASWLAVIALALGVVSILLAGC